MYREQRPPTPLYSAFEGSNHGARSLHQQTRSIPWPKVSRSALTPESASNQQKRQSDQESHQQPGVHGAQQ
jgi:hypothetical protein